MRLQNKHKISQTFTLKSARIAVCVLLIAGVLSSVFSLRSNACSSISECDAEINNLQQQMSVYQKEASALSEQAMTLQNALGELAKQRAVIQAQIDISQAQYDKLTKQIIETENQIQTNRDALGKIIADLYVDDKVTPLEMLASSSTISEYLDKQEYRSSVRNQLTATIAQIKELKAELDDQKSQISKVLEEQKSQKATLLEKESEQSNLLAITKGEEANYQSMISKNQSQIAQARATQAAINARYSGSGGYMLVSSGSLGEYPWNSGNCPMGAYVSTGQGDYIYLPYLSTIGADDNGGDGHGYGCRQCASYVAWRIAKETGKYYQWGDAQNFYQNAINAGYSPGGAQAGSIAIMTGATAGNGAYGHVAWVEAVSEDGQQVLISQYNYNYGAGYGMYSEMWLSIGAFDYYVHIL